MSQVRYLDGLKLRVCAGTSSTEVGKREAASDSRLKTSPDCETDSVLTMAPS